MFDPSPFANSTPPAHADTSRDVLPRGGTSQGIVLPVWLGSTRTRPFQVRSLPRDSILAMQILTGSFYHFTETVEGFDKTSIRKMTLKRRYLNMSLRDWIQFLIFLRSPGFSRAAFHGSYK
ncbi:hypothetical protein TNCV_4944841 [Trichonephila clavipes]|nr:hypothetical protein TNCV_4944841 [Trichonephila clavipes]